MVVRKGAFLLSLATTISCMSRQPAAASALKLIVLASSEVSGNSDAATVD